MLRNLKIASFVVAGLVVLSLAYLFLTARHPIHRDTSGFTLSQDGQQIGLIDKEGIKILQVNGDDIKLLVKAPVKAPVQFHDYSIALPRKIYWSPDKSKLAFNISRDEMAALDTKTKQISTVGDRISNLAWSKDGSSAVWAKLTGIKARSPYIPEYIPVKTELVQVYVGKVNLNAMSGMPLFTDSGIDRIEWTPDGRYLVLSKSLQQCIYTILPSGQLVGCIEPLGSTKHSVFNRIYDWKISPDSRNLAVTVGAKILIYQLPVSVEPVSITAPERALELQWTPDSQRLLYVTINNEKRIREIPIGAPDTSPPHILRSVSVQGSNDREVLSEDDGIAQIACDSSDNVYYLSGSNLFKAKLK